MWWFQHKRLKDIGAIVDGESTASTATTLSLEERRYRDSLLRLRTGVQHQVEATPTIGEHQIDVFLQGIWQELETAEAPRRNPIWTKLSIATAALLITAALLYLFLPGPEPVRANQVESVSTELENSTVDWYDGKDGQTTIWVKPSGRDIE